MLTKQLLEIYTFPGTILKKTNVHMVSNIGIEHYISVLIYEFQYNQLCKKGFLFCFWLQKGPGSVGGSCCYCGQ